MNKIENMKHEMTVAVRKLAESTRRVGGLGSAMQGGLSGIEGTRIHQLFLKTAHRRFPGCDLFAEESLSGVFAADDLPVDLIVQGRCDLIVLSPKGELTLIEVKGFRGSAHSLPSEGDAAHWTQAYLYAHLLLESGFRDGLMIDASDVTIELHYTSFDVDESFVLTRRMTSDELSIHFDQTCRRYLEVAMPLFEHKMLRNTLNKNAGFPYETLREGQKQMMREVIAAIRDTAKLFIVAPTGIGKTVATLYPAIKAQAGGLTDQIFYLTPTRSQRKIAEQALDDLTSAGFLVRSITFRAKEQLCLAGDLFCNMRKCPYAVNYYEKRHNALRESFKLQRILPEDIIELAKKYEVCPFELSLEIGAGCDVVICDYNYVFNPRVRWSNHLDDTKLKYTLLVDEAHNLARRSNEMFSATLSRTTLLNLVEMFKNLASTGNIERDVVIPENTATNTALRSEAKKCIVAIERLLRRIDQFADILTDTARGSKGAEHIKELSPFKPMFSERFLAMREIPPFFIQDVESLTTALSGFFYKELQFDGREKLMLPYFDLLFFQKVIEHYYDSTYINTWRLYDKGEVVASLLALDASNHLTDIYRDKSPVVFFSATMTPPSYYVSLLDADSSVDKPEILMLDSPFDSSRRFVLNVDAYSIRYKDRHLTLPVITSLILDVIGERKGHYLVFSPSFAYQRMLVNEIKRHKNSANEFLVQPTRMTEKQKNAYLNRFRMPKGKRSLVGMTVIGSLFNEGIDLIGEELTGVIIIGTGLPGVSPEREILRQYYDQKTSKGYEYAFMWPGFNRVTQAVGRLIRNEDDFGLVLLVDDRYSRPDYRALLPEEWRTIHTKDKDETLGLVREFWKNFD
ncbi:MAG TPA: DEAD/DEAH box helicase [Clostridiaceae bacterium]|nr:DEAD/DEAH box helicase [Clostridiaceae bacterium]